MANQLQAEANNNPLGEYFRDVTALVCAEKLCTASNIGESTDRDRLLIDTPS
jgi:hypothetical protein